MPATALQKGNYLKPAFKTGILLALLLIALAAGCLLAGRFLFWWFGFVDRPVALGTWLQYMRLLDNPRYGAHAAAIKLAGIAGFVLPLLAWFAIAWAMLKPATRSTHGNARFATHP